jgi:hypothetical protein
MLLIYKKCLKNPKIHMMNKLSGAEAEAVVEIAIKINKKYNPQ